MKKKTYAQINRQPRQIKKCGWPTAGKKTPYMIKITKRLQERKITVELTGAAKDQLIAEGYDPTYGARPLKRAIQREVLDPLAMRVLQGEFKEGDALQVDASGGTMRFTKAQRPVHA